MHFALPQLLGLVAGGGRLERSALRVLFDEALSRGAPEFGFSVVARLPRLVRLGTFLDWVMDFSVLDRRSASITERRLRIAKNPQPSTSTLQQGQR